MREHSTKDELQNYGASNLSPHEFLRVQMHLETCEECQRRLDKMFPNITENEEALFFEDLRESADETFHLNYEEHLKPFVYQTIPAVDREIVESHVETCAECREDLRDLLQFHEELEREKEIRALSKRGLWTQVSDWFSASKPKAVWFSFAAVLFFVGAGLVWFLVSRPTADIAQNPADTNNLPTNQTIESVPSENNSRVNQNVETPPTNRANTVNRNSDLPEKEIEMANLVLPKFLNDLRTRENETLRGTNDLPTQKIVVSAPNGEAIRGVSPVLRWQQIPNVEGYEVAVFDEDFNRLAKIENLKGNVWRVPNLIKGKLYQWQVSAKSSEANGKTQNYLGQGKFYVVSQNDENKINKAGNALERGKAFAEAGLLKEAANELRKYLKANPNSENAKNFLRQIAQANR